MGNKEELKPKALWENFRHICSIPHPSKHEDKIVAWLENWAKEHHIACRKDEVGNLILSKLATEGMKNRKGVILQGHIDMVPQKNSDKKHDFTQDSIEMMVGNDGWVRANGTTLGADNGIGCAAAMAVLTADDIEHGPLEVLITIDEETGMTGAFGLKANQLQGDILINLDSEDEGELYVGCAGGLDATITFPFQKEPVPANTQAVELSILKLKGGHSGLDIHLGRGNSNKVLIRFLKQIRKKYGASLACINGGSLRNAIPREAFATICISTEKKDAVVKEWKEYEQIVRAELKDTDSEFSFTCCDADMPQYVIDNNTSRNMIDSVYACPNGVLRMSYAMEGLVETSTNLAIVKSDETQIRISCLLRSSVDSAKADLAEMIESIFRLAGAQCEFSGGYPGWKPNMDSPILQTMQEVYRNLYDKIPEVKAIHAGLECGLLGGVYPHWDMISFGPTIRHPHSPDEKVHIESVEKFWNFLVATLKQIPLK
jgi:dipeptidase D